MGAAAAIDSHNSERKERRVSRDVMGYYGGVHSKSWWRVSDGRIIMIDFYVLRPTLCTLLVLKNCELGGFKVTTP